jgi:hypothetical protein
MEEEKSLKEEILELKELLNKYDKKQSEKKFSIPFTARVSKAQAKKGWTTVMIARDNRNVEFTKKQIEEQTIMVDGIPRIATADDVLFYKGRPLIILPSWSVKPFSPTDNLKETDAKSYGSQGYRLLLARMKAEVVEGKKKIGSWIIWVIVGLIAVGYLAMKSGAFK